MKTSASSIKYHMKSVVFFFTKMNEDFSLALQYIENPVLKNTIFFSPKTQNHLILFCLILYVFNFLWNHFLLFCVCVCAIMFVSLRACTYLRACLSLCLCHCMFVSLCVYHFMFVIMYVSLCLYAIVCARLSVCVIVQLLINKMT